MTLEEIIIKPLITEKTLREAGRGVFTFEVDRNCGKYQIKKAVEKMFNVHVLSVKTISVKGKKRTTGRKRTVSYAPDTKKAMLWLAKGEKIDLFEVSEKK